MSPLLRNLMFALVLAVILWLGYVLFLKSSDEVVSTEGSASEAARDSQEFLLRLKQLKTIELQGSVLQDARFRSLINIRQSVVEEPAGRQNPFLPISTEE